MCNALEELRREGVLEGQREGRLEGRLEGIRDRNLQKIQH